jgi:hypothetical protein
MVIVMEMSTGSTQATEFGVYGDEVLNAGWAEVPRIEVRLAPVAASPGRNTASTDIEGFMARLYASQE